MSELTYLLAVFFLPLFPFSVPYNRLLARLSNPALRGLLLLAWPQAGVWLLDTAQAPLPVWSVAWALLSAAFYAFRALALREVGLWIGFLSTSAWSLLWLEAAAGLDSRTLQLHALAFSAPFLLLAFLADWLERRFGAAYTGLYGGLAQSLPRFSGVLVVVVLACCATPVFPGFATLLSVVLQTVGAMPWAGAGVAVVWLLWSWAGARLLQGLVVGPAEPGGMLDLNPLMAWAFVLALGSLAFAGLYLIGELG